MDPLDIVSGTADAAFATDELGRIVIWNRAAERLLALPAAQALGKPCHEFLCGKDIFGNRFCDEHCMLSKMVLRHEALHHFQMEISNGNGGKVRVNVFVVVVPGSKSTRYTMIHFLQPVDHQTSFDEAFNGAHVPVPPAPAETQQFTPTMPLTAREVEVVRLLADGIGTREIADSLFISVATTRNHIQNILRKLDVHSKLEAVALALRHHLI